jgi:hypothetical protein
LIKANSAFAPAASMFVLVPLDSNGMTIGTIRKAANPKSNARVINLRTARMGLSLGFLEHYP